MRKLALFAPLAVFIVLGAYFGMGLSRDPSAIPSALLDRPLPDFNLPPVGSRKRGVSINDIKGHVALINVFGSWCASCLVEHPVMMRIAATEDVMIIGLDWKDPNGAGERWLNLHGDPYNFIGDDESGRTAIDLGVTGAPETFVIDSKGRIRHKHTGPVTWRIWTRQLKPLVEKLEQEENDEGA